MAKRHNAYEAAFEDYLRSRGVAYLAVDERRRAVERDGSLKNVDFVVSPAATDEPGDPPRWLVDVKGRRFPSGRTHPQYWRNWTTQDELDSLARWGDRFGAALRPVLVFAYQLVADRSPVPVEQVHAHRGESYAFVAIGADDYRRVARPLSRRWGTVAAPAADFRRLARPVDEVFDGAFEAAGSGV